MSAPNPTPDWMKTLSSALSRPKVQAFLAAKLNALASDTSSDAKRSLTGITFKSAPAPKELPKGSLAYELGMTVTGEPSGAPAAKKGKPAPTTLKMHVLVAPESGQTWIATGTDKVQLTKVLQASLEGAPESGTLASRQDVAMLKNEKLAAASFTSIEAIVQSWSSPASLLEGAHPGSGPDLASLAAMPHKGKTPILLRWDAKASDPVTWTVRADVPKGVVEDALILGATSGLAGLGR